MYLPAIQREGGGWEGGVLPSIPVDAFKGISAFQVEPYRHVRVMSVMDLCARHEREDEIWRKVRF